MQRKHSLVLSGTIVAIIAFLFLHTFGMTSTGIRKDFQTIIGICTIPKSDGYYVIQNDDEWTNICKPIQQIEVDFSKKTIIAVFMGFRPTGGYGIVVKEVIDTGLTTVIKVEKFLPGRCAVTMAITYPYHIVQVDKISNHIIFTTSTIAGCGE